MNVQVTITDGPLAKADTVEPAAGAGAVVVFEGIVRGEEDGRQIEALEYQTYEPMAQQMLGAIGRDVMERHGLVSLSVEHSRGRVEVGACSFRLVVTSAHRKEALAAMDEFIDRLKQDVPIWKRPVWRAEVSVPPGARRAP